MLINRGVNSNWNTAVTASLFNRFGALKHVFYTAIFSTFSKINYVRFAVFTDLFTLNSK